MHRLWGIVRTDFLRRFSSRMEWLFFLVLPLLFTAAVGAGLRGIMDPADASAEEVRVSLYVIQQDRGAPAEALLAALEDVNFDVKIVEALPDDTFGLTIPAGFSEGLLAGEDVTLTMRTRGDSSASPVVEQAVRAAQSRVGGAALIARNGLARAQEAGVATTPEEAEVFFADLLAEMLSVAADPPAVAQVRWPEGVTVSDEAEAMANSAEHASAGQTVTWVQITLLGVAEVLVDERLRGTLKRMLITPTPRTLILGSKLLATLAAGLLQIAILLVGGELLFKVGWGRAPLAAAAVSVAFAFAVAGLGLFLATLLKTRGQASSLVIAFSMTMAALGGCWFPMEITPDAYQQVVQILPATWAMRAYEDILARGATLGDVLPSIAFMVGFGLVFVVLGMVRFRKYE
ncbi:MAG: ABC transporter permease [Anaerolineae bacterium]|nr:ABC transporter permease [Anaerolineae bacterium]